MNIREFTVNDTEAVIAIWRECELVVGWNDPHKDIERKLKVNPELFLVAELDKRIVGSVMGGYEGHRGWINYLAVSPDVQKNGYARRLMLAIEQRLLAIGCPKINLQVRSTNQSVIDFYRHIEFVQEQTVSFGKRLIPDS